MFIGKYGWRLTLCVALGVACGPVTEPVHSPGPALVGAAGSDEQGSESAAEVSSVSDEVRGTPSPQEPAPGDITEGAVSEPVRPLPSGDPCGPRDGSHCVIVELRAESDLDELVNRLREDDLQVEAGAERVTLVMTDDVVRRVFRGRVQYRRLARSSGEGFRCQAVIENVRIPARYRAHIQSLSVGHQICE